MSREEILKSVSNILCVVTNHDHVEEKENLRDDLGMDSLDEIEVVIMIEKKFSIRIPDADVEDNIKTVSDIVNIVEKLLLG